MKHITKSSICTLLIGAMLPFTVCGQTKTPIKMPDNSDAPLFKKGDKLTNGYFTGNAYLLPLLARDKNNDFVIGNVSFEPGARTNWHTHPKGQVLIVNEGMGFYQEKGKPAQSIKKGDVINIPENVEHWHGAVATSQMAHIAITNFLGDTNVVWLKPVSEEEYNTANKQ
jgi:quercetin dioxygenase-like cupin family protein